MRPTVLFSAAMLLLLMGTARALDPTPTVAAPASCFFQHETQSTGLNVPLTLKLDGTNACDASLISYTCFDGDVAHMVPAPSDSQCFFPAQFACQYARAGSFVVSAWMNLGNNRISCGTTQVTAQCLAAQDGLQCGDNAFCCQSQCLGRPSSCGECTTSNSYQCGSNGWVCAPAPDGTSCLDSCLPEKLSVAGKCQQGTCVHQDLTCQLSNFCQEVSCNPSGFDPGRYSCIFNNQNGQFEWNVAKQCGFNQLCIDPVCIQTAGQLTYFHFSTPPPTLQCTLDAIACGSGGCCTASCTATPNDRNDVEGCQTSPGSCADVCNADVLKITGSCQGCGLANATGACAYTSASCSSSNECQIQGCGGNSMVCRRLANGYAWTNDSSSCVPVRATVQQGSTLGENVPTVTVGSAVATPKTYGAPSVTLQPTVLPKSVRFEHGVNPTAIADIAGSENSKIAVSSYYFDRKVIDVQLNINVFAYTDSKPKLEKDLECQGPSACICRSPLDGNFSNFRCVFNPPVNGTYFIRLRNAENETGVFVARLLPGEEAQLYKLVVPLRNREYFVYGLAVVIGILTLYGVYRLMRAPLSKVSQRPRLEKRKAELAKEMDFLKYRLMKGEISDVQYRQSLFVKEKELTDVLARLKEWDERLEEPGPG